MTSAPYLDQHRLNELALVLRLRGRGSVEECREAAARIIARESREAKTPPPAGKVHAGNAKEHVLGMIMAVAARMNSYRDLLHKKPAPAPTLGVPLKITCLPIEVVEPAQSNLEPFPKSAVLVHSGFSGPKLIEDSDYLPGVHCLPAQNLRASILQNEQIARERQARSLAYQNAAKKAKYVG
jgi:hypothetical protein